MTKKLNTPLEIIICRPWPFSPTWKACSFGFDNRQQIVRLDRSGRGKPAKVQKTTP